VTKIVIVEDQRVLASVYRNRFVAEGYQVEIASDGEEGLNLIHSTRPDLVMLDLMLPKLSGIDLLKNLRANPLFRTLPVIVFSNASLQGTVEEAWKAGATMVLSKSTDSPKVILESVRTALKAASESQPARAGAATNDSTPSPDIPILSVDSGTPGRSLLVEDHADLCALMSFLLDAAGYHVTSVDSHAEALRKVGLQEFDLFLVNRICPDGLGLTLCPQLHQLFPRQPIVLYSTTALPADRQAGLDAGARAYLTKPSDLLNIGNLLSDLIKGSKTLAGLTEAALPDDSSVVA
jgi:CheY-like chemotaxis protein